MTTVTIILDGTPGRREYAIKVISGLKLEDGEVWDVVIGRHVKRRSTSQNARLWMLHSAAAREVGCSPEDMHEDRLCAMFGHSEIKLPSGVVKRVPLKRSSSLNKKEFGEFMEAVEAFYISELGVFLEV